MGRTADCSLFRRRRFRSSYVRGTKMCADGEMASRNLLLLLLNFSYRIFLKNRDFWIGNLVKLQKCASTSTLLDARYFGTPVLGSSRLSALSFRQSSMTLCGNCDPPQPSESLNLMLDRLRTRCPSLPGSSSLNSTRGGVN